MTCVCMSACYQPSMRSHSALLPSFIRSMITCVNVLPCGCVEHGDMLSSFVEDTVRHTMVHLLSFAVRVFFTQRRIIIHLKLRLDCSQVL